jgi:hypothetical protein
MQAYAELFYEAAVRACAEAEASVAEAETAKERAERELWDATKAERNKILATIGGHVPARVRPLAGNRVGSYYDPGHVPVWYHSEFQMVFCGSHTKSNNPGPDWATGYLTKRDWNAIKDRGVIPLRPAEAA